MPQDNAARPQGRPTKFTPARGQRRIGKSGKSPLKNWNLIAPKFNQFNQRARARGVINA